MLIIPHFIDSFINATDKKKAIAAMSLIWYRCYRVTITAVSLVCPVSCLLSCCMMSIIEQIKIDRCQSLYLFAKLKLGIDHSNLTLVISLDCSKI